MVEFYVEATVTYLARGKDEDDAFNKLKMHLDNSTKIAHYKVDWVEPVPDEKEKENVG